MRGNDLIIPYDVPAETAVLQLLKHHRNLKSIPAETAVVQKQEQHRHQKRCSCGYNITLVGTRKRCLTVGFA